MYVFLQLLHTFVSSLQRPITFKFVAEISSFGTGSLHKGNDVSM